MTKNGCVIGPHICKTSNISTMSDKLAVSGISYIRQSISNLSITNTQWYIKIRSQDMRYEVIGKYKEYLYGRLILKKCYLTVLLLCKYVYNLNKKDEAPSIEKGSTIVLRKNKAYIHTFKYIYMHTCFLALNTPPNICLHFEPTSSTKWMKRRTKLLFLGCDSGFSLA